MYETEFQDKELRCYDCDQFYIWPAGAQKFFRDKGLKMPKHCPRCLRIRKATIDKEREGENEREIRL